MTIQQLHFEASNQRDSHAELSTAPPPDPPRRSRDLVFGRRTVSVARREVLVDGVLRPLQPRPFDVLVYLIENRDRVISTDELLDHVWKDEIVQPGSLAAAVMRIRKALLDDDRFAGRVIRTHQGFGYRFVAELDDAATGVAAADR